MSPMTPGAQRDAADEERLEPGALAICDLHLDLASDEGVRPFADWLDGLAGVPSLAILGDLFDVWVGPAQARLPGAGPVLAALARLAARGTRVRVVPGNRDFLLGAHFERASGAELAPRGFVARTTGEHPQRVLFVHGDELCTRDRGYLRLRAVLRSPALTWLAPCLPLPLATRVARSLRRASTRAVQSKLPEHKAMQAVSAAALVAARRADVLVCGHAHEHAERVLPGGARWIVLDAFGGPRDLLYLGDDGRVAVGCSATRPARGGTAAAAGASLPRRFPA